MVLGGMAVLVAGESNYETPGMAQTGKAVAHASEYNRLPVSWKSSQEERNLATSAWKVIRDWQKDGKADGRKLHVVYVTLEDRPALKGYKARLDRIVKNIQAYYSDQMKANGYPPLTFALDLDKKGNVVIHDAHLNNYMADLSVDTAGPPIQEVAEEALRRAGVNPDREYSLIVVQMPDKKGPYFGNGDHKSGRALICDAPHLDARNLTSREEGNYMFGSLGMDNTVYIGGMANVLGTSFGLPHTSCLDDERGVSLTGSGNYEYGKDLRKEGLGAYLLPTDALQLASLPLFSGKSRECADVQSATFYDMDGEPIKDGLKLKGKVKGTPPVYGVVAFFDPAGDGDFDANAAMTVPDKEGNFTLDIVRPEYRGVFELRLVALQADGSRICKHATMVMKDDGIDLAPLEMSVIADKVKKCWIARDWAGADAALKEVKEQYGEDPAFERGLKAWDKAVHPLWDGPADNVPSLAADSVKELNLVDAKPRKAVSGWWMPFWDSLPGNPGGPFARFSNYMPKRFMYTHAPGNFTYDLGGKWKTFDAVMGMPVGGYGSVVISIRVDGREIYLSPELREGESHPVHIDVKGIDTLSIDVLNAPGKGKHGNWFVVADPLLKR